MDRNGATGATGLGVSGNTFIAPVAFQFGGEQHVHFTSGSQPPYRIAEFPPAPTVVPGWAAAAQPSRLLWAWYGVVPFSGREGDLDALTRWRDAPAAPFAVRLLHGPGGQGKTRLAAHFAELSRAAGWTVWQGVSDPAEDGPSPVPEAPDGGPGTLLVVDYAERWPVPDLRRLLRDPLLRRGTAPVRVLLLARPSGYRWDGLATWCGDQLGALAEAHPLPPLAANAPARTELFVRARDSFAGHLGLPTDRADRIAPPPGLEQDEYAQVLTLHVAALAAVDCALLDAVAPDSPARATAYLLSRERQHWGELHRLGVLTTEARTMGQAVLTATYTGPLLRDPHGRDALGRARPADGGAATETLLNDHRFCYPPTRSDTILEPLHPDRLGEDFIALSTPAADGAAHPAPEAVTDDAAGHLVQRLLTAVGDGNLLLPWTRNVLTVLIETAQRWPHIATGQLFPLLRQHPYLALQAGGNALGSLVTLEGLDLDVLEAVEAHFPEERHTDLDTGMAAVAVALSVRLLTTPDPVVHANTYDRLALRLHRAGLREPALVAARNAGALWRRVIEEGRSPFEPNLAASLGNFSAYLGEASRWEEALPAATEALDVYRQLADPDTGDPAAYRPAIASALANIGTFLVEVGRPGEALETVSEAVEILRQLADPDTGDPVAHESDYASALSTLGIRLSAAGRKEEALAAERTATAIRLRLASPGTGRPATHDPDLAISLANLGTRHWEAGQFAAALRHTTQAVDLYRRLANPDNGNPAAYEPGLATALANLGLHSSAVGQRAAALATASEAVRIYRRLADPNTGNPAAHQPDFANALGTLAYQLWLAGRREEALDVENEALLIRLRLADPRTGNPAVHEPDLARTLSSLGFQLSGTGRLRAAVTVLIRAEQIYRRLAYPKSGNPTVYEPALANTLFIAAAVSAQLSSFDTALEETGEAVAIYRRHIQEDPVLFPQLYGALSLQADVLDALDRPDDAATVRDWLARHPLPEDPTQQP
ncbi:tetratricopeptide repeat protein [Streptomyces sp. NPDC085540]|uniref:tetratricopeptide repeat protein n=1 Tax=Streptomyces sp. NPDC085540 TaxID=3365730 RepID=UPI0037D048DD